MAIKIDLPAVPSGWSGSANFKAIQPLSQASTRTCEPVGPGFLGHARRTLRGRTFSEDEKLEAELNRTTVEANSDDEDSEPEDEDMLRHDAKDWKSLDQYAVLGLSKYRWRATEDQVRKAHRRRVLKHHPDKLAAQGHGDRDDFFKCIQKAFETLIDPTKRRQWDSVDPKAEVKPSKKAKEFFEKYNGVFEAEGRFSNVQPVPGLGDASATKEEVDSFYSFFYKFDSWRTFEWRDEEVPDDSANRDHKRYVEKKNKAARQKYKKEDSARLQKLVEAAMSEDPRIKQFKEDEKKAKAQRKWEREAGSRAEAEAAAKAKEEADKKAQADAAAAADKKVADKKAKEAAKSAKKKNKRALRAVLKDVNYLEPAGSEASASAVALMDADMDALIESLDDVQLGDYVQKFQGADAASVKDTILAGIAEKGIKAQYFK